MPPCQLFHFCPCDIPFIFHPPPDRYFISSLALSFPAWWIFHCCPCDILFPPGGFFISALAIFHSYFIPPQTDISFLPLQYHSLPGGFFIAVLVIFHSPWRIFIAALAICHSYFILSQRDISFPPGGFSLLPLRYFIPISFPPRPTFHAPLADFSFLPLRYFIPISFPPRQIFHFFPCNIIPRLVDFLLLCL